MANRYDQLKQFITMLNLHVKGKKVKALEMIEDFLFTAEPPRLAIREISLLLSGFEGKKGLLQSLGGENHLRKSLKKSSHYALQLTLRLFKEYLLKAVDHVVLSHMKLDKHLKHADSQSNASAYHFCMVLYQHCRNIPVGVYIKNKTNENKFMKWYSDHKSIATEEQEPTRWSQVKDPAEAEEASLEEPVNKLEDPLGLKPTIHSEVITTSNLLGVSKTKVVTRNSILQKLDQLDITSPNFKPNVFMSQVHQNVSVPDLSLGLKNLKEKYKQVDAELKGLIAKNANAFADCNHFYEDLAEMVQSQCTDLDAKQAQDLLLSIEAAESQTLTPMLKKKAEIERLRSLIGLTQRFSYLFKLPSLMQTYLSHNDIKSIADVYERHIKPLKSHIHIPVVSSILGQVNLVLKSVQSRILANIQKTKTPTFEMLTRSIDYLLGLECLSEPVEFCLTHIHSLLNSRISHSFQTVQNATIPWLLSYETYPEAIRTLWGADGIAQHQSLDVSILKVIEKTSSRLTVFRQLLLHYYTEKQREAKEGKIKSMLEETAELLCQNLGQCLSLAKEQGRKVDTKKICFGLNKIAGELQGTQFSAFLLDFTEAHIRSHFTYMEETITQFHLKEVWALDLQNPGGTALPRLCYCYFVESMNDLKTQLPGYSKYDCQEIMQAINKCISAFLGAMLQALNSASVSKAVSRISEAVDRVCASEIQQLEERFVQKKATQIKSILAEGVFSGNVLGQRANEEALFYSSYQRKQLGNHLFKFEPRPYVLRVLSKVGKTAYKLAVCVPLLQEKLVKGLVSQVLKAWSSLIEGSQREIDSTQALFLWVDAEFYIEVAGRIDRSEKRVRNLLDFLKKLRSDSSEASVLTKKEQETMENSFRGIIQKNEIAFKPLLVHKD